MIYMIRTRITNHTVVSRAGTATLFRSSMKKLQLEAQGNRLHGIKPHVKCILHVIIFAVLTEIPKNFELPIKFRVARRHRASIPKCAEILGRIKTECAYVAPAPRHLSLKRGKM